MHSCRRFCLFCGIALWSLAALGQAAPANQRLILKDGSYQVVKKYEVKGDRVRYVSAERGGEWEELPAALVDWRATEAWAKAHAAEAQGPVVAGASPNAGAGPVAGGGLGASGAESSAGAEAAAIDKEERDERADEVARMPTVSPGLRLPDEDGVFVLDTFHGQPELIEVPQNSGDLNTSTPHNVFRSVIPVGGTKQLIQLEGARAKVQLHVSDPAIYVSLDAPEGEPGDRALTVDTHGAGSVRDKHSHSSPNSRYVILRVQTKRDTRVIGALKISLLGKMEQSVDIVRTKAEILPGKRWMKLTPVEPLAIDEYALMEVLGEGEVNLAVWDFGVNPRAAEAKGAITPVEGVQ